MRRLRVLSEGGVSMVEPLVAVVVLSFSMLGSVGMFAVSQDGISGSAKSLEAMALVESRLERLRALPYGRLLGGDPGPARPADVPVQDGGSDGDAVAGDGEYTARQIVNGIVVTWSVRPDQPSLGNSRWALLRVVAEWPGKQGQTRKVRLAMRRANPVFSGGF
jgi:hypothetical protein